MKVAKFVFLGIICSHFHIIRCNFLSELFGNVEPQKEERPMKLTRRNVFSMKRRNDKSYDTFTAFPLPPPMSHNEGDRFNISNPLIRRKRAQEIVIGRTKTFENSSAVYMNVSKTAERDNNNQKNDYLKQVSAIYDKELKSRRLIHGHDATIEEYPYVVSIQREHEHWCSGAIINPSVVITTANCVWKSKTSSKMTVRVGSRRADSGGYVVGIKSVMKHPDWSVRKDPDCDIALLKLNASIRFTDGLHAAELPNKGMMPPFDDVWVTSWGTERPDGHYDGLSSLPLQVYHAQLVPRDRCNNVTSRFSVNVTDTFICVAQTDGMAPCTRDTGAPAVSDGVVWGLASWGLRKTCGTARSPAMFSYVAAPRNLDFIVRASSELMSEERTSPYAIRE